MVRLLLTGLLVRSGQEVEALEKVTQHLKVKVDQALYLAQTSAAVEAHVPGILGEAGS